MMQKLRRRFIAINMLLVGVVLLAVLSSFLYFNVRNLHNGADAALDRTILFHKDEMFPKPEIAPPDDDRAGMDFITFGVVLAVDADDALELRGNVTISDDVLEYAVNAVLDSGEKTGTVKDLGLRFLIRDTPDGTQIAFADLTGGYARIRSLTLMLLGIGAAAMAALFLVSRILAGRVLSPVEKAWAQQRRFVADASHEIKTPITVILANLGRMLAHPDERIAEHEKWLTNTRDEAEELRTLVEDMLYLARTDADRDPVQLVDVHLSDILQSCLLSFEPVAFERNVALATDVVPDIHIQGDAVLLKRLCTILLDNAVKYAGTDGTVHVALKPAQGQVVLSVQNTGDPIPEEDLPRIFDRFYRVDKARTREQGNYGLGLAIAREILDVHHARVDVRSSQPEGTVFTVRFRAGC